MFQRAERFSLESFTDVALQEEGLSFPEIAEEGWITAIAGDIGRDFTDTYKELKGWFIGIESKRKYIDEQCKDTIEWLREEDRSNPKTDLDVGRFKTWCKTSETFYWRFYFLLHEECYSDIIKAIKNKEISNLEVLTDFSMKDRMKVTRMLDSVRTIKDLMVIVEKYRARCNIIFDGLVKRDRKIQSFPFQVLLLGYADLNRTVKKIVNLAT